MTESIKNPKFNVPALLALTLLIAPACTSRKHCNPADAQLIGALDGRSYDATQKGLQRGEVCTDEYSGETFRKDYQAGYTTALAEVCTPQGAGNLALLDVARGSLGREGRASLATCAKVNADAKALNAAYDKTYVDGMCTPERVNLLAVDHGKNFSAQDTTYVNEVCKTAPNRAALLKNYQSSYELSLKSACDFGAIKTLAQDDARKNFTQAQRIADLSKCPGDAWNTKQLYSSTYDSEILKIRIEEEQRLRQEAEKKNADRSNVIIACELDDPIVRLTFNNLNTHTVEYKGGMWDIRLLDKKGKIVGAERVSRNLTFKAGDKEEIKIRYSGPDADKANQCTVRYVD